MSIKQPTGYRSRLRVLAMGAAVSVSGMTFSSGSYGLATWFGAWDYVLRHDDEGQPQAAFARLRGDNGSLLWLTCQRLASDSDKPFATFTTVAVAQKQFLGRSDVHGRSTVYWFDGGSPEVGHWVYRDRHGQIPDPGQVQAFVDKLAGATSLTIELSNFRYETQQHEFRFDPKDAKTMADRFRKDCGDILRSSDS
ncbi:hypothetical protein [Microvirga sp. BSC39]|uniref:hypothetical protein n=1 Tax=Microvirga sp. BSC39 TaxID=1549810 RepID=UPI0004E8F267|nr:hypothetical protein [Microvirga sp. BSC39]KFG66973.1 hypothetical protein JH26_26995 [Microvirga sp. BSC39]